MELPCSVAFHRLLQAIALLLVTTTLVNATEVMHRPETAAYKAPPRRFTKELKAKTHVVNRSNKNSEQSDILPRAGGKVSMGYFTNWGIYGANFQPSDIIPSTLTHILYSFADVSPDTGAVKLTDSYADQEKHYPSDSWSETGNNLYGALKQLYLLKLKNRNLKVLLSIGGWTYSQSGHFNFVTSASSRATFVANAVQLVEDYGFDGIDIDFEYPSDSTQGQGLADMITALRTAFTALQSKKGDSTPYLISAAVAAGSEHWGNYVVPQMNKDLSFWNLMAYDFAGSWSLVSDNQANVYGGQVSGVSGDSAVKSYLARGATASKINFGMPLYGRAFESTGGLRQSFNGIGPGTVEAGIYSYETLPLSGATIFENVTDISSYSYDSAKKELVSYDTPNIIKLKAQYVQSNGLAGSMFWELSTDKLGADSLVGVSAAVYGSLESVQNHISYPSSKWDNVRANMGTGSGTPTTTVGTTPTTSTGSTPTGGSCSSAAAWVSTTAYTGGMTATYNGHLWTAKWWTQNETPGGSSGVWTDNGPC